MVFAACLLHTFAPRFLMKNTLTLYQTLCDLPEQENWPALPGKTSPPLAPVRVYNSDETEFDLTRPFICRRFPSLPSDPQLFESLLCAEKEVFGYNNSPLDNAPDWDYGTLSGREIWEQYQHNALQINILDSECTNAKPLLDGWSSTVLQRPSFIGWVLTLAPKLTYFHVDPPYGNCFMYLCEGKKIWLFIPPEDLAEVERRHSFDIINRLPLPELLVLDGGFLWGKIQIGKMGGGDLIYFPDYWPHYVRTFEHSFGYGGYFGQNEK